MQGALEAEGPTTIVRLTRNGEINHAAVLDEQDVKDLWSDPLLRYSNVLDGLFHDAVVLYESDSDCRYYQAVLDATGAQQPQDDDGEPPERGLQILFTHCGGKARMSSVIDALSAVKVPVIVVVDFDVLRDANHVKKLVVSVGGSFEGDIKQDLTVLQAALKSDAKVLRRTWLRDSFNTALDGAVEEILTPMDLEKLRAIIRAETGWDKAKRSGKSAVHREPRTPRANDYSLRSQTLAF